MPSEMKGALTFPSASDGDQAAFAAEGLNVLQHGARGRVQRSGPSAAATTPGRRRRRAGRTRPGRCRRPPPARPPSSRPPRSGSRPPGRASCRTRRRSRWPRPAALGVAHHAADRAVGEPRRRVVGLGRARPRVPGGGSPTSARPSARAKAAAPEPASSTWGVFSITRRAASTGLLKPCSAATAPALRSGPLITQASSS